VTLADALKMTMVTFQALFPAINPASVRLAECRRVLLVHYDRAAGCIELRHYAVRAAPVGVSRGVKKVLQSRPPDLGELDDVADFVLSGGRAGGGGGGGGGAASESEFEDESSHVVLPQGFAGRGNARAQQSAIKLSEIGPRLRLALVKIEGGLFSGEVLHHAHVTKSAEEAEELRRRAADKDRLKLQRRAQQDANVRRKEAEKAAKKGEKDALRAKRQRAAEVAAAEGREVGDGEAERDMRGGGAGSGAEEDEGEEEEEEEEGGESDDEEEDDEDEEKDEDDEDDDEDDEDNVEDVDGDEDVVEEGEVGDDAAAAPPAPQLAGSKRGRDTRR
jgi:hypothetical protein